MTPAWRRTPAREDGPQTRTGVHAHPGGLALRIYTVVCSSSSYLDIAVALSPSEFSDVEETISSSRTLRISSPLAPNAGRSLQVDSSGGGAWGSTMPSEEAAAPS